MRTFTIEFKEKEKVLSVQINWGDRGKATDSENRMADSAKPAMSYILRTLPGTLTGEGHGSTMEESAQKADVMSDIWRAGR